MRTPIAAAVLNFGADSKVMAATAAPFACYLLVSQDRSFADHTYIGFTVNPPRRIRQHNGEIKGGAMRTHRKRPWYVGEATVRKERKGRANAERGERQRRRGGSREEGERGARETIERGRGTAWFANSLA